jgi:hypothetical protein
VRQTGEASQAVRQPGEVGSVPAAALSSKLYIEHELFAGVLGLKPRLF